MVYLFVWFVNNVVFKVGGGYYQHLLTSTVLKLRSTGKFITHVYIVDTISSSGRIVQNSINASEN